MTSKRARMLSRGAGTEGVIAPPVGTYKQATEGFKAWAKDHPNGLNPWRRRRVTK